MPTSVDPISLTIDLADVDSTILETCKLTPQDKKCWFSDADINFYLSSIIICPGHLSINPIFLIMLAKFDIADLPILADEVHAASKLFCPVNIDNEHWVLFVYCKSSLTSFYIDPLATAFKPHVTLPLIENLNCSLNFIFDLKATILIKLVGVKRIATIVALSYVHLPCI